MRQLRMPNRWWEMSYLVSPKEQGPRFDPSLCLDQVDGHPNLILLCRIHHKMVDDQCETYTVEVLRSLKVKHERWFHRHLPQRNA